MPSINVYVPESVQQRLWELYPGEAISELLQRVAKKLADQKVAGSIRVGRAVKDLRLVP